MSFTGLNDSKPPKISRTFLSILIDSSSAVVSMVSIIPLIFCSFSLFSRFLGTDPMSRTTIGRRMTFIYILFCSLARSWYLSRFSPFFSFPFADMAKSTRWQILDYKCMIWSTGRDWVIFFLSQSHSESYVYDFLGQIIIINFIPTKTAHHIKIFIRAIYLKTL